ncbi:MAG: GAF domain-containing protein [Planctomycetes bacterium]|nr:GAF domain-containing protein [Planctomycetota bacterium]
MRRKLSSRPSSRANLVGVGGNGDDVDSPAVEETPDVQVLKRRIDKLSLQLELGRTFANTTDLDKLMDTIFERAIELMEAEAGSLWLVDRERGGLVCHTAEGPTKKDIIGVHLDKGQGIVGWVAEHQEPTVVYDAASDERFSAQVDKKTNFVTRSMICVPLATGKQSLGAIQVINKRDPESRFDDDDRDLLHGLAQSAAVAIRAARHLRRMKMLQQLDRLFNSTLDFEKLVDTVFAKVIEVLSAEAGSIWLVNRQTGQPVCRNAEGPTKDQVIGMTLEAGQGVVGWCIQKREPSIVYDARADKRFAGAVDAKTGFQTRSMICVPLVVKDEAIGAIQVINRKDSIEPFDDDDVELLRELAQAAAISIQNAWLYQSQQKVKELSAILDLSKEITSTLDLDHVMLTVVNLTSTVVHYDRAAIGLFNAKGQLELTAVSGKEGVDRENAENKALVRLLAAVTDGKKEVYIADREKHLDGASPLPEARDYFAVTESRSLWARPLSDEEGMLGVFVMESRRTGMVQPGQAETLQILTNQATVALRNAQLYADVPASGLMGKLARRGEEVKGWPLWKKLTVSLAVSGAAAACGLVRWPVTVAADCEVTPFGRTAVHAGVDGIIERIPDEVREGREVDEGQPLAYIQDKDLRAQRSDLDSRRNILQKDMQQARGQGQVGQAQLKELELEQVELKLVEVDRKLALSVIRAPRHGTVLTPRVEETVGTLIGTGKTFCEISNLHRVRIEVYLGELDVPEVRQGMPVAVKISAVPWKPFPGARVESVRLEGEEDPKTKVRTFTAVVEVENEDLLLRPGMTGRARITGDTHRLGWILLRVPYRWLRSRVW